ncbi:MULTISPECIES: GntR family transcriptional regulator [unclassified Achromobacter]|uniref:GntR family transcriptional regulator n=1 Tax=unclassified Achromobacter TaxID=2626865 RepID=UPI000B51E1D2|nr:MULTISPECIES: GntR family transcriptional regulator [unclassified Achromobacter]OWT70374.1 GntR family transcriptional regulator [Achromobacter sp. HZ34]OWT71914.1 GntR family transcriptional regulator [Achromobacter sp. HZ28]
MAARYMELAQDLIDQIKTGRFAVGAALPSEVDLSQQHGVSRATVRSALLVVQNLGLISRRKRAGIRVEAAQPRKAYERSLSDLEDLMQFAVVTERHVQATDHVVCDAALAAQLQCEVLRKWMRVAMLRVDMQKPDAPLCWTDVFLDPDIGAELGTQLHKSTGLICEMVEEKFGCTVDEVRQEIRAVGVPARMAAALGVEADTHALEVTRWYASEGRSPFEITVSVFPADRFTYALTLRKHDGVQGQR